MSSVLKNSLLRQHFKSQFFDLWRELALKQRKRYIKNGKLLCNIKIILFVKNDLQKGFYKIKDNEIVTNYRTRSGRNANGFSLTKYENIKQSDVYDLLIFILIFSNQHFESIELLL